MRLGTWFLTPTHDLKLTFRRGKTKPFTETFTLTGKILSVSANELVFAARTKKEKGLEEVRLLRLKGIWQADHQNRLAFQVKRGTTKRGLLTFEGAWELGENHQILYRYQRRDVATGTKKEELLSFRGVWEIREKDHLTYLLDLRGGSRFDFRAAVQSPSLIGKKGEIRYQVGIRLKGRDLLVRDVVLFGKWKLSRDFSLSFEMAYQEGKRHTFSLRTAYRVNEKHEVVFSLKDKKGNDLGIEVTFTRRFFEAEGKAFLRFYQDALESRVEGGVQVPF